MLLRAGGECRAGARVGVCQRVPPRMAAEWLMVNRALRLQLRGAGPREIRAGLAPEGGARDALSDAPGGTD